MFVCGGPSLSLSLRVVSLHADSMVADDGEVVGVAEEEGEGGEQDTHRDRRRPRRKWVAPEIHQQHL